MSEQTFDVVIIGAGPGGYVCAIRAAQLGLKVALIEERSTLGGTCLNVGCIPSKAMLHSSHLFYHSKNHLKDFGINATGIALDLKKMQQHKATVIKELTQGVDYLMQKNKVTVIKGHATFKDPHTLEVKASKGKVQTIQGKSFVIATGSTPTALPTLKIDEKVILSSTGALEMSKTPKHLVVIGGGYIGLEMGSVWARLGAKVTVVEGAERILATMDQEVTTIMQKALENIGIVFKTSCTFKDAKVTASKVTLTIEHKDQKEVLQADKVLVAVGRQPNTHKLGLTEAQVKVQENKQIPVNDKYQTNQAHIYAIGDVITGPMLAHKAEEEGVAVAEILAGQAGHVNYGVIPAVIYTQPEVATVGQTEEALKEAKTPYKSGKFIFKANARSKCTGETAGFVKVLAHKETDRILGVHIIGAQASTLIAEAVAVMEYGGSSEDMARICHAHPTESEALKEAALAVLGRVIHS